MLHSTYQSCPPWSCLWQRKRWVLNCTIAVAWLEGSDHKLTMNKMNDSNNCHEFMKDHQEELFTSVNYLSTTPTEIFTLKKACLYRSLKTAQHSSWWLTFCTYKAILTSPEKNVPWMEMLEHAFEWNWVRMQTVTDQRYELWLIKDMDCDWSKIWDPAQSYTTKQRNLLQNMQSSEKPLQPHEMVIRFV